MMNKTAEKIKVLIIDKQSFFRIGMLNTLSKEPDLEIFEHEPEGDIPALIETKYPDVILLGIDGMVIAGLELGKNIVRRYPNIRLIIISSASDDTELFDAVKIGAVAYINKDCKPDDLISTIRDTYRGRYPINDTIFTRPKVAEQVLQQFQRMTSQKMEEVVAAPITQRETQILTYICNGNSNKQIADMLDISEQTIKNHVSSILRKLNANDRAHAVVLAVRRGLISIDEPQQPP